MLFKDKALPFVINCRYKKHTKPKEKLTGHASQRNRKDRHIINLAGEPKSREPPGCWTRHENCETINKLLGNKLKSGVLSILCKISYISREKV